MYIKKNHNYRWPNNDKRSIYDKPLAQYKYRHVAPGNDNALCFMIKKHSFVIHDIRMLFRVLLLRDAFVRFLLACHL